MSNPDQNVGTTIHDFNAINFVGAENLPREGMQSRRLHEPEQLISSIDPITGRDIDDLAGHPYLVDGNITMYFETEATRQAYIDEPTDHPFPLVDNPYDEGIDEG
ncbi:MAG: hypothetical protein KKA36_08220 [Gammaproteobacteria bacterium]|nr:hypothetical protein [Gammaproteobacteria bacterium]MBU2479061.1 hypothetical protein [Gammaproteobacteria bacterium]